MPFIGSLMASTLALSATCFPRHAGRAAPPFSQALHSSPRPEVAQHAGGTPLACQGHRLQPEPHGTDLIPGILYSIPAGKQSQMACP